MQASSTSVQSWTGPGAASAGEGDVGSCVAGPARGGVGLREGAGDISWSLCGGFSQVKGGPPGASG